MSCLRGFCVRPAPPPPPGTDPTGVLSFGLVQQATLRYVACILSGQQLALGYGPESRIESGIHHHGKLRLVVEASVTEKPIHILKAATTLKSVLRPDVKLRAWRLRPVAVYGPNERCGTKC